METVVISLLIIIVPLFMFVGLNIVLALLTSKKSTHATEVGLDRIKFVVKGSDLFKILANLHKAELDCDGKIVPLTKNKWLTFWKPYINPINIFLRLVFGAWWVSWLYPQRQILKFKIYDVHRYHQVSKDQNLKEAVEVQAEKDVEELYRYIERPYYMELTLGKDGSRVAIVLMIEGEIIDPAMAAMSLGGKFFKRLDPAVTGKVEDWANFMDYPTIITTETGKQKAVWQFVKEINRLLKVSCGIKLTDCYIEAFRSTGKVAEATDDKAVATIEAEVLSIRTEAEAKRTERLATANAATYREPLVAMTGNGVDADVAAMTLGREKAFSSLSTPDTKVTTFVEGNIGGKPSKKPGLILPTK